MSCAPFVSSPHDVVRKMLEVARATKDDVLVDLGCGDGRILSTAIKDFGVKAAFGYEIREDLFKTASGEVEKLNLGNMARVYNRDLFQADLKEATLITLYLTTYANERLKPKLYDQRLEAIKERELQRAHDIRILDSRILLNVASHNPSLHTSKRAGYFQSREISAVPSSSTRPEHIRQPSP